MLVNNLKETLKKSLRVVITACLSLILFVSVVNSALAITSLPEEGEASLNAIQEKTDRAASQNPYALQERERTRERRNPLNLVQGDADKDKMYNQGQEKDDETITQQIENALENITK
ncbi:low temperature-induced protein [Gloeothece citriformis PCC 7424]|uniref:Low temperature-induced protein n=1 Tax=Gloeothece citriformis (strain PCC 7424) TaxID=65393 RepID=B7KA72_GLOC7|nr:low temperature-induced protein [Gloeothece citriformis]ACK72846.1 low temperature-induced protein [Gloeothece citriformis PCC 7424]